MKQPRTLPIRIAPVDGEGLDSWLEATAHRSQAAFGDLSLAIGLPARKPSGDSAWMVQLTPAERASIAAATGTRPGLLESMTLSAYFNKAIRVDPETKSMGRGFLWGRGLGSRFCPDCLGASGGRWQLKWRLRWSFACTAHYRLLADACGQCGTVQRQRPHVGELIPEPCRCAARQPDARNHQRCGSDLTAVESVAFDAEHPAIRAQQLIDDCIAAEVATFGVYQRNPQPRMNALADIRAILGRALAYGAPEDLDRLVPKDLLASYRAVLQTHEHRKSTARPTGRGGLTVSRCAATAAVGIIAATASLKVATVQASGRTLDWLVTTPRQRGLQVHAANIGWGAHTTPVLAGIQLAALHPHLKPNDQLRYRSGSTLPNYPTSMAALIEARANATPTALWPTWSLQMAIPNCEQPHLRLGLSAATLIVSSRLTCGEAAEIICSPLKGSGVSHVLQLLQRQDQWRAIREALTAIADFLAEKGSPIDFNRRRRIDYSSLMPDSRWAEICLFAGSPGSQSFRARVARCYLYERLSGSPADTAPFALDSTHFRRAVSDFAGHLTTDLSHALLEHAQEFLHSKDIRDEPPIWRPPADLLRGLQLPGMNPDEIDTRPLSDIAPGQGRIEQVVAKLEVSSDVARYLVEANSAPSPSWAAGDGVRPRNLGAYRIAIGALPRDKLTELYVEQRKSLSVIAAEVGVGKAVIGRLVKDYGLELRVPGPYVKHVFDKVWLRDQYIDKQRSLPDIAAEVGVSTTTVARWVKAHDTPVRRRGGGSHSAALSAKAAATQAPKILRPALTTPGGWMRLQRLAESANWPTLGSAAKHLGVNASRLAMQITRVEQELGQQLFIRAERGRPMALTQAGRRVVSAISAAASEHTADE